MNYRFVFTLLLVAALAGFWDRVEAQSEYQVVKKIVLGGNGSWDYVTIDDASRRAYIGRSDRVMVVDMNTDSLVGEVQNMSGVHGAAVVPELNRGFATSGKDNTVRIFDLKTFKEVGQVKAGAKPDAIIYDTASKKIFAFNHDGTTATVIDPKSEKSVGEVELGGSAEAAVADGKGTIYVNVEDKSEIAVIDANKLSVRAHWSLAPGEAPTGLALDRQHKRLFAGCENKMMMIVDAESGKVVAHVPIGEGTDGTGFDDHTQNAFSSNGKDGTLTVIHEDTPDKYTVAQTVQTQEGARTMAVDSKLHQVWTVTAKLEKTANDQVGKDGKRRKSVVPGTFTALVIGE
jgi:DNA-binding beta-propeller fold protein YncE